MSKSKSKRKHRRMSNTKSKRCSAKTQRGQRCKNHVFHIEGENNDLCKLHYLMGIHNGSSYNEPREESAAPVIPGILWIGSIAAAMDDALLNEIGFKGVLNASGIEPLPHTVRHYNQLGIDYHTFTNYHDGKETFLIDCPFDKYKDTSKKDFFRYMIDGTRFLKQQLGSRPIRKPVLVHCHAGMNRSAAVICAYLILVGGMTYNKAMRLLEKANEKRGLHVLTNSYFKRALKDIEKNRRFIRQKLL